MFGNMSFSKVVSMFGFVVSCAFITYVIRTMGYFSVVAPEYLGFFIETDLILGAIRATPFVVAITWCVYTIFWLVSIAVEHDEKTSRMTKPLASLAKFAPSWLGPLLLWSFYILLIMSAFIFEGENFILRVELAYIAAMFSIFWAIQQHAEYGTVNPVLLIGCLFSIYSALLDTGKFEAINDLNHSNARYSVIAADKNYANVLLLRVSSGSVLIKAGNEVVLYERSAISKIERATDQIRQR